MKVSAKLDRLLKEEFLEFQNRLGATVWQRVIQRVNQRIINLNRMPKRKELREIVKQELAEAHVNYVKRITRIGLLLGAITMNIKGQKDVLMSAKAIPSLINISKPKAFIAQLFNLDSRIQRGLGGTNIINSKVLIQMEKFYEINFDRVETIAKQNLKLYDKVNQKTQKAMVKNYLKASKLASKEATPTAQVETLARTLTNTSATNVKMIVATEGNAILNQSQLEYGKALGLTKKRWIQNVRDTQRMTPFHLGVINKVVKIDDNFKAVGMSAQHPCDDSLPIGERANCKCYLEFE